MNQKHCTSQPLSRRLCEAKVKQESEFYWWQVNPGEWRISAKSEVFVREGMYSAFLASELLEMLPQETHAYKINDNYFAHIDIFDEAKFTKDVLATHRKEALSSRLLRKASTPSEALGEMLLHLITNGLIGPKGI